MASELFMKNIQYPVSSIGTLDTENLTLFLYLPFQVCGKVFSKMCNLKVHKLKHEQDRFRSEFFKTGKVGKLP